MAWCRQATSHYLSQWWPWSMSPYGVTRPQWVNHLSCCPGWVKSCFWWVKLFYNHIEIECYLSEYSQNGCSDGCHEKFRQKTAVVFENRPISQIPECTCSLSHNALLRTEMCTVLNGELWDIEQVHSRICELGQFVAVMVWCNLTTSAYLNLCWSWSLCHIASLGLKNKLIIDWGRGGGGGVHFKNP